MNTLNKIKQATEAREAFRPVVNEAQKNNAPDYIATRTHWYALCHAVEKLEAQAAEEGIYCANYNVGCPVPTEPLPVVTEYGKFCCCECAREFQQECEGEAAVREEDLRDY